MKVSPIGIGKNGMWEISQGLVHGFWLKHLEGWS